MHDTTHITRHTLLLLAYAVAWIMALAGCGKTAGYGAEQGHAEQLRRLGDSIRTLSPSAIDSIRNGLAHASDSIEHEEYTLLLAQYYWLSEHPERADPLIEHIKDFVRRHDTATGNSTAQTRKPRLNSLLAGALSCQAARSHNFHKDTQATIRLYHEAYCLMQYSESKQYMPKTCANLADAYIAANDLPSAAKWYRRALFLTDSLQLPKKENVTLYMGLAQIYLSLHDFDTARRYYKYTERYFDTMTPSMQSYYINNLGNFYYYTKDYRQALASFLRMKRWIERNGMLNNFDMYLCKVNLADVYLNLGCTDKARQYLSEAEPFFRRNGDSTAVYYCNTIHIGIAVQSGDTAEVRRVLRDEHCGQEIPYNIVNIRSRYLRKYYELTSNYREAYRSLNDDIAYTDSLEHNRQNMRSADIMARFTADTLQLHHELAIEHKNANIRKAQTLTAAAVTLATFMALLLAVWFMHTRKKALQSQMDIMNLKLNNVRNRISPHFMFNVLNNKIVNSGEKEASELMELARLIRTNLDMSSQPYIMLDRELEFVKQYIRVERYLLGDDFEFNIDIDPDVDTTKVKIPSMFIQILTENAIVHGLKGKEGHKALHITIRRSKETTNIRVSDNGPGFNARRALKKGTGLGIITQTIAVTNERNKQKIRFEISNRTDDNGHTIGCNATLRIPNKMNF